MADVLGNSDGRYLMLARGMSVFRCGGGMNYVHGGASPQEMIIPSIFVKTQKGMEFKVQAPGEEKELSNTVDAALKQIEEKKC